MRRRIELYFDGELSLEQEMCLFRELEGNPQWLLELASAQTILNELNARVEAPSDLPTKVMSRLGMRVPSGTGYSGTSMLRRSGYSRLWKWAARSSALVAVLALTIGAGTWMRSHVGLNRTRDVTRACIDTPASSLDSMVYTAGNELARRPRLSDALSQAVVILASADAGEPDVSRHGSGGPGESRVILVGWPDEPDGSRNSDHDHGTHKRTAGLPIGSPQVMTPGRAADFLDVSPASTYVMGRYFGVVGQVPQGLAGTVGRGMDGTDPLGRNSMVQLQGVDAESGLWSNLDEDMIGVLWGSGAWAVLDQPMLPRAPSADPTTSGIYAVPAPTRSGTISQPWQARLPLPVSAYPELGQTRRPNEPASWR